MARDRQEARKIRAARVRYKLRQVSAGRLRLSIFRSSKHTYAQVIDDSSGKTLVSASTLEMKDEIKNGGNIEAATAVGKRIAEKALAANIQQVVFDRGGYIYHGRTKALADAAREGGLDF